MNFGTPVPLLLGIILIIGAVSLFFLDRLKPGYERDGDKIYAILSLVSGIFLLGNLTMELIPAFQQIIMVGMFITLMVQNIRARTPKVSQAASGYDGPLDRDTYRPSRSGRSAYRPEPRTNVRAELDRRDYPEERMPRDRPMLGGREDSMYGDYREPARNDYEDDYRTAPPGSGAVGRLNPSSGSDRIRVRRPRPSKRSNRSLSIAPATWDEEPSRSSNYREDVYSGSSYDRDSDTPTASDRGNTSADPAAGPPYRYGRDQAGSGYSGSDYGSDYNDYRPLNLGDSGNGDSGSDYGTDYRDDRPRDYGY